MAKYSRGRNKHAPPHMKFRDRELYWEAFTNGTQIVPSQMVFDRASALAGELGSFAHGVANDRPHVSRRRLAHRAEAARLAANKAEANGELQSLAVRAAIHDSMQAVPESPRSSPHEEVA